MKNVLLMSPALSDAATLAGSSQVASLPIANLQAMQPKKKWRSTGTTEYVTADMGAAVACNGLALIGHNLTSAATLRVRAAASAANVTASPALDTGAVSAWPVSGKPADVNWPQYFSWLS